MHVGDASYIHICIFACTSYFLVDSLCIINKQTDVRLNPYKPTLNLYNIFRHNSCPVVEQERLALSTDVSFMVSPDKQTSSVNIFPKRLIQKCHPQYRCLTCTQQMMIRVIHTATILYRRVIVWFAKFMYLNIRSNDRRTFRFILVYICEAIKREHLFSQSLPL